MSGRPTDLPPRLLDGEATDFERRVLEGALRNEPSAAASARMARAHGVTAGLVGTGATAGAAAANKVALGGATTKATVAAGVATAWPWISAGVLTLALVGAVAGPRLRRAPVPGRVVTSLSPAAPLERPPAAPSEVARPSGEVAEGSPDPLSSNHRAHLATAGGDLRDEIEFIDGARAMLAAGDAGRALDLLGHYQDKYPTGTFRPEATAIRIEALLKRGRAAEARALAARFVAEHRGSLLAARVAGLVGLSEPAP